MITVTTPSGTVSQMAGNFSASALNPASGEAAKPAVDRKASPAPRPAAATATAAAPAPAPIASSTHQPSHSHLSQGPPSFQGSQNRAPVTNLPQTAPTASATAARTQPQTAQPAASLNLPPQQPLAASGPSTPSAIQVLANGGNATGRPETQKGGVEFNHAITFVNTIKQRYSRDQSVYKKFLEILQTYQRDGQEIHEVSRHPIVFQLVL